jgi:hypothetical protein
MNSENARHAGEPSAPSLAEVVEVIRPQVEKIEEGFKAIRVTLDALAEHLGAASSVPAENRRGLAPASKEPASAEERKPVAEPKIEPPMVAPAYVPPAAVAIPAQPAGAVLPPLAQPVAAPVVAMPAAAPAVQTARPATASVQPQPARAGSIPATGPGGGNWSQIIFGDQLKADPGIGSLSGTLLSEVYATEADAIGMLGYLLAFRSADQERKPKLLKELGEAFYLWKPDGNERLLEPLIHWVHATLDQAGISNRIEVVQVGDRYDMQRHNAKDRGVEVCGVAGWVVLRDNGKVYSKANVSVR